MSKKRKAKFKVGDMITIKEGATIPMIVDYHNANWEVVSEPVNAVEIGLKGTVMEVNEDQNMATGNIHYNYVIMAEGGKYHFEEEFLQLDVIRYVKEKKTEI